MEHSKWTLDDLQVEVEKLLALLKDRETGMMSWHLLLNERLKALHEKLCPVFPTKK